MDFCQLISTCHHCRNMPNMTMCFERHFHLRLPSMFAEMCLLYLAKSVSLNFKSLDFWRLAEKPCDLFFLMPKWTRIAACFFERDAKTGTAY